MDTVEEKIFWDQLLELVAESRVVPIIGRDLLTVRYREAEVLFYPFLAQRRAEYLGVSGEDLPEGDELNTVACRYMKEGKPIEDVYSVIKMVMPSEEELSIPPGFSKLASIHTFKLFVTTTFDSLLERAINQERFAGEARTKVFAYAPNAVQDLPGPLEKLESPVVFHLFGKLSATPGYAVTQEDILEWVHSLQSGSRQLNFLFDALSRASFLILGCSFGEWLARFFIRTAKCQRLLEARGSTDYVADKRISGDHNLLIFLRHFSTRTKIYQGGGAPEFLDELHRRWTERVKNAPPPPAGGDREVTTASYVRPGAIFLSYAKEDRPAASRIHQALEAAGMDVFFDKDDLWAGDDWEPKLKRSISEASLFIAVISKNTLPTPQRRFFRREWNQAGEEVTGKAGTESFIIPVIIDEINLTEVAPPESFCKAQYEILSNGQTDEKFIEAIRKLYRKYQKALKGAL
jgi:hypothetical protein